MASYGTPSTSKSLAAGAATNADPGYKYEDISSVSLTSNTGETISPTGGGLFRGLSVSVAGQLSIIDMNGNESKLYYNTGPCAQGGRSIIRRAGNAATVLSFILD